MKVKEALKNYLEQIKWNINYQNNNLSSFNELTTLKINEIKIKNPNYSEFYNNQNKETNFCDNHSPNQGTQINLDKDKNLLRK